LKPSLPQRPSLRPGYLLLRVMLVLSALVLLLVLLRVPESGGVQRVSLDPTKTHIRGATGATPGAGETAQAPASRGVDDDADSHGGSSGDIPALSSDPLLEAIARRFTGDLGAMRKRGFIRVLVSYNRTNFFLTGASDQHAGVTAKGFEHDFMEQYKKFLNHKLSRKRPRLQMVYVPVAFDRLLAALNQGEGDVVAAGMTITRERAGRVAFTRPYLSGVNEVLVTHGDVAGIDTLQDLSGQRIQVLRGSSYAKHLQALSRRFEQQGQAPIQVEEVAASLQTEDMLELVNAGALTTTVADQHLAKLWAGVLPHIKVRTGLVINQGGELGWAVRKDNPALLKSLNRFVAANRKGTELGNILFQRFYRDRRWIGNPTSRTERAKLKKLAGLFKKYGRKYNFEWMLLAAQAYQESGLVHSARSHKGAIGIMQVKASTAADKHVAIKNIRQLEANIHAGSKYLAFLRDRYFSTDNFSAEDRVYFSLAAYNAGPRAVAKIRARARRMGLNPNHWFGQVELAALRHVGRETVTYVRNILKYSTAYKLSFAAERQRGKDKKQLAGH